MRVNKDGTITDYISALDQEMTFSPEAWEKELKLREQISKDINIYIASLEAAEKYEASRIKHEHLASISQHDWYVRCENDNDAIYLENVTYRVIVKEQGQKNELSFSNRHELWFWAGY